MRGLQLAVLLVFLLGVSEILGAPKDKEQHIKKKALLKLRSDTAESLSVNGTETEGAAGEKDKEAVTVVASPAGSSNNTEKEVVPTIDEAPEAADTSVSKPKPQLSYMSRIKSYIRSVFEYFNFVKHQRNSRMLGDDEENSLYDLEFTDTFKSGLRSVFSNLQNYGKQQCNEKTICRAGRYLKDVKGKEIFIVLLEKASPSSWKDSVEVIKKAAIHKDECRRYQCPAE